MAACGVASRRKCEEIIGQGVVTVNGSVVTEVGTKIDEDSDQVCVHGKKLTLSPKKYYIMNKPAGYVTTNADEFGRKTVFDFLKDQDRIFAVGRLDRDSAGLLILTNDGEFSQEVSHPKNRIPKTYEVFTKGKPNQEQISMLAKGIYIDGYRTSRAKVRLAGMRNGNAVSRITLCEGKNRQVRKMYASVGLPVKRLTRIGIGGFSDRSLKPGAYRRLKKKEIALILQGGRR
jgi:pseudouridine synthase